MLLVTLQFVGPAKRRKWPRRARMIGARRRALQERGQSIVKVTLFAGIFLGQRVQP